MLGPNSSKSDGAEFAQFSNFILHTLPKVLEELLGIAVPPLQQPSKEALRERVSSIFSTIKLEIDRLESPHLSASEKMTSVFRLLDAIVRASPARIPKRPNAFAWLATSMDKILTAPVPPELRRTGYQRYLRSLRLLVARVWQSHKAAQAAALCEDVAGKEGPTIAQRLLGVGTNSLFSPAMLGLLRRRRRVALSDLDTLIEAYATLSGLYEKSLIVPLGFHEILRGQEVSYEALAKKPLAERMRLLGKDPKLAAIVTAFDRILRNAIAHRSFKVFMRSNKIEFIDVRASRVMSPAGLLKRVREANALVTALLLVTLLLHRETFRRLSSPRFVLDYLKRMPFEQPRAPHSL